MNLRQLKAFRAVCRTGSITRASELIHLSQPALTRQIQDLESFCGCKLFERTRHGIVLTDEGELFQVRAEEMLSLAERTAARTQRSRRLHRRHRPDRLR